METRAQRILGLDIGTRHTGVAVLQTPDLLLHSRVIRADGERFVWRRVACLWSDLVRICREYQPHCVGMEDFSHLMDKESMQIIYGTMGAAAALSYLFTMEHMYVVGPKVWQAAVLGATDKHPVSKEARCLIVEKRLGVSFQRHGALGSAYHDVDATGIALYVQDVLLKT